MSHYIAMALVTSVTSQWRIGEHISTMMARDMEQYFPIPCTHMACPRISKQHPSHLTKYGAIAVTKGSSDVVTGE